jgi:alpha-D-xyloside xylohydrolase
MPVYVKEGSIVPFGPELQYTSEKPADTITLYVYTGKDAAFQLYEDQGTTYDYEKGQFSTIPFQYKESTKTLTIGERKGAYPGMLAKRTFRIVWVTPVSAKALDLERKADQQLLYEGKKLTIKL